MSNDKIVIYQTFVDPINANIVKGLINSHGIECYLSDENIIAVNPLYAQAVGGIKLHVFEKDIELVNSILSSGIPDSKTVAEKEITGNIICPNCQSTNVAYGGSVKRKFGLWNMIIPFLLMIYPFTMRMAYHCFDCDHEFKKV